MTRNIGLQAQLEACLFVAAAPISSRQLAAAVDRAEAEVDAALTQLASRYQAQQRPFVLESVATGWQFRFNALGQRIGAGLRREKRLARLSSAAVEVLAVVACRQPVSLESVNSLRGRESCSTVALLERRGLVSRHSPTDASPGTSYVTTSRFLEMFGLKSLAELPRAGELTWL